MEKAKNKPVQFRVNENQMEFIEQAARKIGISKSEFIRNSALSMAEKILEKEVEK